MRVDRTRHPEHTALAHDVKPASLTRAYLASRSALSRYIATFFVEREEIEDTLQQAYLEALVAASKTEIRSPRAFLFRVARNIALNKKTRQRKVTFINVGIVDDSVAAGLSHGQSMDMAEQAFLEEKLAALVDAVDALPPQCQKVFLLQRIDGLTYKQIGKRLGISVRTVEKHLEKALLRCTEHLIAQGFVDPDQPEDVAQVGGSKLAKLTLVKNHRSSG